MNYWDPLLDWCSERAEGTLDSFFAAASYLEFDRPELAAHQLSILGHIEVDWNTRHWAAAPPTIVVPPDCGGNAFLTGARPRWLVDAIQTILGANEGGSDVVLSDLAMRVYPYELGQVKTGREGPTPWWLKFGPRLATDIPILANHLGIESTTDILGQIGVLLPSLDDLVTAGGVGLLAGRGLSCERFDVNTLRWTPSRARPDDATGTYRVSGHGPYRYYVNPGGSGDCLAVVDKRTAVAAAMRRAGRDIFRYDAQLRTLTVYAAADLPLLHARTAVLCAAALPRIYWSHPSDPPRARYDNIPPELAAHIGRLLGQGAP